jgi:hypothetical protein
LKIVVPEIIQSAAQYHLSAGIGHYILDLLAVLRGVAVNAAVFAGRFGV